MDSFPYIVLVLLLLFFLVPSAISLRMERDGRQASSGLRIDWAFWGGLAGIRLCLEAPGWALYPLIWGWKPGLLRLRLDAGRSAGECKHPKPDRRQRPSKPGLAASRASKPQRRRLFTWVRLFFPFGPILLRRLRRTLVLQKLQLEGGLGFENPAATGFLGACLQSLTVVNSKRVKIDISPDFERPGLCGRLYLVFRLHLGYLLFLALVSAVQAASSRLAARAPGFPSNPVSSRI